MCPSFFADMVDFSDEEGYGKYLDLHECYVKYINLKGVEVYILQHSKCIRHLCHTERERDFFFRQIKGLKF